MIKLLVFIGVVYFLYRQLQKISVDDLQDINLESYTKFIFVLLLMPINWLLEGLKWWITVRKITSVSKRVITHSLLSGISTGLITPNRLGNFIGRMLYFKGKVRGSIILGTLYGNLAQFIASVTFGVIGIYFVGDLFMTDLWSIKLWYLALIFSALLVVLYFSYPFIPIQKVYFFKRYMNLCIHFRSIAKFIVLRLFAFSLLRYFIFIIQYVLLLLAFGAEYSCDLMYAIFFMFFITTLIPTLILGKLAIRESVALLILTPIVSNPLIIVLSSLVLWLINLGIPGGIGLFFLLKARVVK